MSLLVCSQCRSLYEMLSDVEGTVSCRARGCTHPLLLAHPDARISWVRSIIESHEE